MSLPTVESLQEELASLRVEVEALKKTTPIKEKKPKKPRAPSAFNEYMREAIPRIKLEDPTILHSKAFVQAANEWKDHKKTNEAKVAEQ